jgi:hypothetical protein
MRRTALATLLLTALLAAPAAADDRSVYTAWVSHDKEFTQLGKEFRRGQRVFRRSHGQRPQAALKAAKKTINLLDQVIPAMKAEQPSSDAGRRAKAHALASTRLFRASLVHAEKWLRAYAHGHPARGARERRQANRLVRRANRAVRAARKAFREAGITSS